MNIRLVWIAVALLALAARTEAQPRAPEPNAAGRFEITDNSFLVEEAFNQEPGIFQNIASWTISGGDWDAAFTQEWPLNGQRHQLSYTIPFAAIEGTAGLGDVLLNYRYQATTETSSRPALSPRLSLVLPTSREGTGAGGLQVNVPVSKQRNDLYFHGNAGFTWLPRAPADGTADSHVSLMSPHVGASGIWRITPMFNLMLETLVLWEERANPAGLPAVTDPMTTTVSPGFRRGWNVGDRQIVIGAAAPISRSEGATTTALLTYFSYELPY
jgi:hypothetical protein